MNLPSRKFLCALAAFALLSTVARAQAVKEPDKEKNQEAKKEESKVATVEVTPAQATAEIGDKVQCKAVGKDGGGNVLPDAVKFWYAAPQDIAGADANGLVTAIEAASGRMQVRATT